MTARTPTTEPIIGSDGEVWGTVLSLFDYTGVWSEPYREVGATVVQVDIQHGSDVMDPALERLTGVVGILAAPPCTDFANCGARWFAAKDADGRTEASIALVRRTLSLIQFYAPDWWAIENPAGRIHKLIPELGAPRFTFQPYEFGEPYSKATWLWGSFERPTKGPIVKPEGMRNGQPPAWFSKVGGKSIATKNYRSRTSPGFARAFAASNPAWA